MTILTVRHEKNVTSPVRGTTEVPGVVNGEIAATGVVAALGAEVATAEAEVEIEVEEVHATEIAGPETTAASDEISAMNEADRAPTGMMTVPGGAIAVHDAPPVAMMGAVGGQVHRVDASTGL